MTWISTPANDNNDVDIEVLQESALFMAQATIENAILEAGIKRADLARKMDRPRSFVSRMLSGSHNLTVKTMALAMAACGFEVRFERVPIVWNWKAEDARSTLVTAVQTDVPAEAGTTLLVA